MPVIIDAFTLADNRVNVSAGAPITGAGADVPIDPQNGETAMRHFLLSYGNDIAETFAAAERARLGDLTPAAFIDRSHAKGRRLIA